LETEFTGSSYPSLGSTANGSSMNARTGSGVNANIVTLATDIYGLNGNNDTLIYATSSDTAYAIISTYSGGGKVCFDSIGNSSTTYTGTASNVNCTK